MCIDKYVYIVLITRWKGSPNMRSKVSMEDGRRNHYLEGWTGVKPYVFMIMIQFGLATLTIIAKFALNEGMSTFTFVVYRHVLATAVTAPFAFVFERNAGPRITCSIFLKIMALALLEPVLDQNMYYLGMKITSATFSATMSNVIPAVTFLLAWILRLERVDLKAIRSIAKVAGTIVSVSGAMVMTLYKGPIIGKGSLRIRNNHSSSAASAEMDMVKGSIIIIVACSCWAAFIILQTITLREYPLELTLATLICLMGAAEGAVAALVMERGGVVAWSLGWNSELLVIVFSAIICSGMAYCLQGSVMKEKGPVFVTAFSPLSMILVAAAGLVFLGEDLFLGGVIGSLLIVLGLYMVVWGKSRDPPPQNQDIDVKLATDA